MRERIGIFGGSFNPVHLGHLVMAQDALEHAGLHRVLWVPAAMPPHKPSMALAPAAHRLAMLRLAVEADRRFEVCADEVERGGISYTVDTVRRLRDRLPDAELHLIIGGDTLRELHTWRAIEEVLSLCRVITVARPGASLATLETAQLRLPEPWPARLLANVVMGHLVEISSSDIRSRLARGQGIRYLVPDSVAAYSEAHSLFRKTE